MDNKLKYLGYKTIFNYSFYTLSEENLDKLNKWQIKGEEPGFKSHACFASLLSKLAINSLYRVNINIKFLKYKDKPCGNTSFLSKETIFEWFNYIEWLFNTKLKLQEDDKSYIVEVDYSSKKGQIMLLLTMIRFVFEVPFQQALDSAIRYKKEHNELSLFYILNYILYMFSSFLSEVHYWGCSGSIPIKMSDEDYKKIILESDKESGFQISRSWLTRISLYEGNKEPIYKYEESEASALHKIVNSLDCFLDGSIYNKIKESLNSLIYETD